MTFPTAEDFIKCGSPLGEYELHCNQEQMNKLISEHEIVERLKELKYTDKVLTLEELIDELDSILENKK